MKQVLYVEDSATSQLLMRKYVSGLCELTITPSLRTAASLLESRSFDLLIADFIFPEGDATGLIQQVRSSPTLGTLPIVVVSSSLDAVLLSRVLKAGANDGHCKPLKTLEFRSLIERMLHDPYFRSLEHSLVGVCCFQWVAKGIVFQFCPELNLTLSGPTKEDVTKMMLKALQEKAKEGIELGSITHEAIAMHTVHS
jgi:CheY-like chemotaxis protein